MLLGTGDRGLGPPLAATVQSMMRSGLRRSSGSNRSGLGGHALGDHALGDHARTAAGTAGATTLDRSLAAGRAPGRLATAAGLTAGTGIAAGTGIGGRAARAAIDGLSLSTVAATVLPAGEQAAVALLLTMTREQAAMAPLGTVATVTGNGSSVTAHEGDGDEGEEHRDSKTQETLHHKPPLGDRTRVRP